MLERPTTRRYCTPLSTAAVVSRMWAGGAATGHQGGVAAALPRAEGLALTPTEGSKKKRAGVSPTLEAILTAAFGLPLWEVCAAMANAEALLAMVAWMSLLLRVSTDLERASAGAGFRNRVLSDLQHIRAARREPKQGQGARVPLHPTKLPPSRARRGDGLQCGAPGAHAGPPP